MLIGALAGGIAGHFATVWLFHQGYYAMILPGALAGLGASIARSRFLNLHLACATLALAAGILTEWHLRPFLADPGLPYFLSHITTLQPVTLLMLAAGTLIGFWIPFSRRRAAK